MQDMIKTDIDDLLIIGGIWDKEIVGFPCFWC